MKKLLITTAFVLIASQANAADGFFFKPYVGADYQFTDVDYESGITGLEEKLHGGNVHIGANFHKNFGLEATYQMSAKGKDNLLGAETKVDVKGPSVDLMGYLPVGNGFDLIGTVGVSYFTSTVSVAGIGSGDESEFKARAGAGAQYWFTKDMNVRGLVRYQGADFDAVADSAVVGTLGVNFQF